MFLSSLLWNNILQAQSLFNHDQSPDNYFFASKKKNKKLTPLNNHQMLSWWFLKNVFTQCLCRWRQNLQQNVPHRLPFSNNKNETIILSFKGTNGVGDYLR